MSAQKPVLILIAGPNGSGKSTFVNENSTRELFNRCEHINPDLIAQNEFGNWNSPSAVVQAAKLATERRYRYLAESRSFSLETVFSSEEKLEFVRAAVKAGFFIRLIFIGTDDPSINISRVAQRVRQGGHDVPTRKIVERYPKSIANLGRALPLVDRGYVYDNSVDGDRPKLQFCTVNGCIQRIYNEDYAWSNRIWELIADF